MTKESKQGEKKVQNGIDKQTNLKQEPTEEEQVILVNNQDEVIGAKGKLAAHQLGLLHRAFSVFLVREGKHELETLLQQRQKNKYHCGGLWSNACCSHPRVHESILAAGERRLFEELGVTATLSVVGSFMYRAAFTNGLVEHEFDHVLVGVLENPLLAAEAIPFNPEEVGACRWISFSDLTQALLEYPEQYTPWLQPAQALLLEKQREWEDFLCLKP